MPAAVLGRIYSPDQILQASLAEGQRPSGSMPIPSRAVLAAEEKFGFGSSEHRAAIERSKFAFEAYLKGDAWEVVEERPSLQQRAEARQEKEIGLGGARGGSKSYTGIRFLIAGNYWEPDYALDEERRPVFMPINQSYVHHPYYFGLCIRRNQGDLDDWIEEARRLYLNIGGEFKGRPDMMFTFPSGARIRTGHLADPDSFLKYIGKSIHRLVVEELIQLPNERPYSNLLASVRSKFPEIHPQVMVSFNPAGGPGVPWVHERFIEPKQLLRDGRMVPILGLDGEPIRAFHHDGTPVYPEPVIREEVPEEVFRELGIEIPPKEQRTRERVFLPARLVDNPYLMHDTSYVLELATIPDPIERRAYLFGEWNLVSGSYFSTFRPNGPVSAVEPDNANHVIPAYPKVPKVVHIHAEGASSRTIEYSAQQLEPWWPRMMGGDWGWEHEAAFLWGCATAAGPLHIYKERVFSQTPPEIAGAEIARESILDLNGSETHSLTLWMGWDPSASQRVGADRTLFEYLAKGIRRILGPHSVYLPDVVLRQLDEEAYARDEQVSQELVDAIRNQRRAGITIRRAPDHRVIGWQLVRSMFNWTPVLLDSYESFDPAEAMKILFDEGEERYRQYIAHCSRRHIELLPKLQIWDCCTRLIEALPRAQKDEKNQEDVTKKHWRGSDVIDALRYLCCGFREEPIPEPRMSYVERRVGELLKAQDAPAYSVNDLIRIRTALEKEHEDKHAGSAFVLHHPSQYGRLRARQAVGQILFPSSGPVG